MKLYRARTIVEEYDGCKDVTFCWFRCGPGEPRPYAELIDDYDPSDDGYTEGAINELFTATEANALKAYLDREHGHEGVTTIEEAHLPIPNNMMGVGAIPVGGGDGFQTLNREPAYKLPFKVRGYFNLVDCELADGSGVYHHRLLLFDPDGPGTARMQTNEEAAATEATE